MPSKSREAAPPRPGTPSAASADSGERRLRDHRSVPGRLSGARPGSAWPPPSSPVLVAHGAPPDAGPAQEHAAPGAHAVAAALARGPPVQQQPQRPPAAGARPLFVLLAQALAARPAEMLQLRLQTPVAQGVKPEDSVE